METTDKTLIDMMKNDQLIMFQIGVLISEFIDCKDIPNKLSDVAEIIFDNLGVKVKRGDDLPIVLERVKAAIKERDELSELEDSFYDEWLNEELFAQMASEMCAEIDRDIIKTVVEENRTERFEEAMKGIQ